jgi:Glycosyl transferase family 2
MLGKIKRRIDAALSARKVATALRHVSGPQTVALQPDAAGVVILAHNAGWCLRDCLDHHFQLGAVHAVVIDAGSNDQTAAIASADARVTLLSSKLSVGDLESDIRTAAARRVFQGGWILFAEPDEKVELPAALGRMLAYANSQGFTAYLGQILDFGPAQAGVAQYTREALEWVPYGDPSFHLDWFTRDNRVPDAGVRMLAGGMRALTFGEDPVLSKHVLVRNLAEIGLMTHPHCASNVTVADVTVAVRRDMFAGDWQARDRASVAAGLWGHGEDTQRLRVAAEPGFAFVIPHPQRWTGTDALLRDDFLYASESARAALSIPR